MTWLESYALCVANILSTVKVCKHVEGFNESLLTEIGVSQPYMAAHADTLYFHAITASHQRKTPFIGCHILVVRSITLCQGLHEILPVLVRIRLPPLLHHHVRP